MFILASVIGGISQDTGVSVATAPNGRLIVVWKGTADRYLATSGKTAATSPLPRSEAATEVACPAKPPPTIGLRQE
jgi:hypothetical protein